MQRFSSTELFGITTRRGSRLLIHCSLEGVLGFGECEHRPFQLPRVLLIPRGTLQIGNDSSGKGLILPLKQTKEMTRRGVYIQNPLGDNLFGWSNTFDKRCSCILLASVDIDLHSERQLID